MVSFRLCVALAPLIGVGEALSLDDSLDVGALAQPEKKNLKAMSEKQCGTMCQRFAFSALKEYSADFGKISHPTQCVAKCKELTPSLFSKDEPAALGKAASLLQAEPIELKKEKKKEVKTMSEKECGTMCQRFGFSMLKQYSEDFGKVSHPTECVAKCKELTPSIFTPCASSLLQTEPITTEDTNPKEQTAVSATETAAKTEKKTEKKALKKISSNECQVMCQRFGMPQLKEYDPGFGSISHPTQCVSKCKELTPKVFSDDAPSFLQVHSGVPSFLDHLPGTGFLQHVAEMGDRVRDGLKGQKGDTKKKTKQECKGMCQMFATDKLAETDPAFKDLKGDATKCVEQCDKSEHFET